MKKLAAILVFVLASAIFAAAQYDNAATEDKTKTTAADKDKGGGMDMTGWVCNSKCVKQDADKASCDAGCKEKGGDVVFIDDQGKSWKVANQKMAKSHAGKKVKMTGKMKGEAMDPAQIVDLGLGGG
jgi:hypothetical protein